MPVWADLSPHRESQAWKKLANAKRSLKRVFWRLINSVVGAIGFLVGVWMSEQPERTKKIKHQHQHILSFAKNKQVIYFKW